MASTSAASIHKSFKYDVFLSFRGDDTRLKFVSHLYTALLQKGIQTYKDDKNIKKGEMIDTQLIESIEESRFFIIVFSKDYADSSWCLDELVKIMECQKTSEQTAYPIFYDVEPTEIRKQSGAVGEAYKRALEKHKNNEAAEKWREALKGAGNLAGWESNGDESKLIQIIVDDIFKKICSSSSNVDGKFVGMETRIEDVLISLELDAPGVRMIGIWGIGGGGKTTLAKAVFDRISVQFEGKAFVENVRAVSKSSLYGLNKLQKQILRSVLNDENIKVRSVHEGTNMMKRMIRGRKVLIVLDDVDDREQLEELSGEPDWFKSGSIVIITTRDKQVLLAHGVKLIAVNLLSRAEAICLLSKNAFKRDIPIAGYEDLSQQVVKYANGLPLTIKVLGSMLYGQTEPQWIHTLERLKKIPFEKTMEKLELSYIDLEEEQKGIFLDVACILKGWNKDDAVIALKSSGFFAEDGLRVLEQKSLITIYEDIDIYSTPQVMFYRLEMHDHIEEMGKVIVRRVNHNKPETHSRLWIDDEMEDILANNSATQAATQCIKLDVHRSNIEMLMKGLANMKELRFLQLDTSYAWEDQDSNWNLPNTLRFLRWDNYPFSSFPNTFQATNLVGLQMVCGNMDQLWEDGEEKPFPNLRFLKFTRKWYLRTLDLSLAPNLETLILEYCWELVEVHFQVTPNLKELHIHYCKRLEKLHMPAESPKLISLALNYSKLRTLDLSVATNLETLILNCCTNMVELRMPAECPKLVNLYLTNCFKLRTLHLGIAPNLEELRLEGCPDMVELHMPAECPKLVILKLIHLEKLRTLHFRIAPNLQELSLEECTDTVELHMPAECPKLVKLELIHLRKLRTFHLGITPKLQTLSLRGCDDMVELRMPAECPKLVDLELIHLEKLRTFHLGITPNLEKLILGYCTDMVELHMPAECPKLIILVLYNCIQVAAFPEKIGRLECLEELDIFGTGISRLPESIFRVKGLRIAGSRRLLESYGFTPEMEIINDETLYYIDIKP